MQPFTLENMCNSNVRNVHSLNKLQLEGLQTYKFTDLLPDTTYIITGAAVNYKGTGNTVSLTITTTEEGNGLHIHVLFSF